MVFSEIGSSPLGATAIVKKRQHPAWSEGIAVRIAVMRKGQDLYFVETAAYNTKCAGQVNSQLIFGTRLAQFAGVPRQGVQEF